MARDRNVGSDVKHARAETTQQFPTYAGRLRDPGKAALLNAIPGWRERGESGSIICKVQVQNRITIRYYSGHAR